MKYYACFFLVLSMGRSALAVDCNIKSAIKTYHDVTICQNQGVDLSEIAGNELRPDEHREAVKNFLAKKRTDMDRYSADHCPKVATSEKALEIFLEERGLWCKSTLCSGAKSTDRSACHEACDHQTQAQMHHLWGFTEGIYAATTGSCSIQKKINPPRGSLQYNHSGGVQ